MHSELPHFYAARRQAVALLILGVLFAVSGLLFLRLMIDGHIWFTDLPVPRMLGYLGTGLWIAAAGFLSVAFMSVARNYVPTGEQSLTAQQPIPAAADGRTGYRKLYGRVVHAIRRSRYWLPKPVILADWPQSLITALFGGLSIYGVLYVWRLPTPPADPALIQQIFGAALIGLAFPLLVLERVYANLSAERLPEAPQINRLIRVALTSCLGLAVAALLLSAGFGWARYIQYAVAALIFATGAELTLRSIAMFFVPYAPIETRQATADSSIARLLLRLSIPNFRAINLSMHNTFGIDLSRSWALAFVRQASLPILALLAAFSWCITGVTGLAANQRGIYERFGAPVAIFGPGVHLHLPWPFGSVRLAENGVIHQLPIEFHLPGGEAEAEEEAVIVGAEEYPPEHADRLWSDDHPFEGSYLIAHVVDGKQSFQLVDIDMTVIYRIGLTDEAVRNAAYNISDPDELIQAIAGQLLTSYFARHTLPDVIANNRQAFTDALHAGIQSELDKAASGIEAIAVSIEAVHPPPGAAGAYHRVQAAGIKAATAVFTSRGDATRQMSEARLTADSERSASLAKAEETVATAKADSTLFEADRKAYGVAGQSFLLERWFDNLGKALDKSVPLFLVDHRLQGENVPLVDFRGAGASGPASGQGAVGGAGSEINPYGAGAESLPGYQNSQGAGTYR